MRDPDLGRDRRTAALGSRDWNYFTTAGGFDLSEWQPAESPWAPRRITMHDRFDRTLGIPDRTVTMWPSEATPVVSPGERAAAVCQDLLRQDRTPVPWPDHARALAFLEDIADSVYARTARAQDQRISESAGRYDIDAATARDLATGVGGLIARTTHRKGPGVPGLASLNLLSGAHLHDALHLFLARDEIRRAQAFSDPDLPRLWILANGLHHGVSVEVMRTVPALSVGPAAAIIESHDDLLGWDGMATAVQHMTATVQAAVEGHRWLRTLSQLRTVDERALAIGVISLTQPSLAARLARPGMQQLTVQQALWATRTPPAGIVDLTDQALKSVCDRNGWLLGSPGERTQREMTQRSLTASASQVRDELSAGDSEALDRAVATGPDDAEMDRGVFRKNPPSPDVVATQQFLRATSTEALRRLADFEAPPRLTYAQALAHRFPAHLARSPLTEAEPAHLLSPDLREITPPPVSPPPQAKRGPGRQPIGPEVETRLPQRLREALDEQAALAGVTRPELMRRYLTEAITTNMRELRGRPLDSNVAAALGSTAIDRSPPGSGSSDAPQLNAAAIVEVLNRHQVRYVTIGSLAAQQQGAVVPSQAGNIAFTPASGRANLQRLSAALDELGVRVRTAEGSGGLALSHDAMSLARSESCNLVCANGKFDLSFRPSGTDGYDDLIRDARMGRLGGQDLPVASLRDIIRSKTAAGHPEDIQVLPTLYAAMERQGNLLRPPEPPGLSGPDLGPAL